jgi:hypothetical protein
MLALMGAYGLSMVLGVIDFDITKILAFSVLALGLMPGLRYLRSDLSRFPVFELFSAFTGFCFGFSSLFYAGQVGFSDLPARNEALVLVLAAQAMLFIGYYAIGVTLFRSVRPLRLRPGLEDGYLVKTAWFVNLSFLLYRTLVTDRGQHIVLLDLPLLSLSWLSVAFIFREAFRSQGYAGQAKMKKVYLLLAFYMVLGLLSGAIAQAALYIVFYLILYLNAKKRVLVLPILLSALAFFILNPIKQQYRNLTWEDSQFNSMSYSEKAGIFVDVILNGTKDFNMDSAKNANVGRVDFTDILGGVMMQCPSSVPYAYGETYRSLWTIWIPRILWKDKPASFMGNEWAHWFRGFLGKDDDVTAFNLPWLVEFYINFGVVGVLGGMFLLGLIYAYLRKRLTSPSYCLAEYSLSAALLFGFWESESNLALSVGGMFISAVTYYLYFKLLRLFQGGR